MKSVPTLELFAINWLSTGTVAFGEVTTLKHELRDDTVEFRSSVSLLSIAELETLAELAEVIGSLWYVIVEELEDDPARWFALNSNIELLTVNRKSVRISLVNSDTHIDVRHDELEERRNGDQDLYNARRWSVGTRMQIIAVWSSLITPLATEGELHRRWPSTCHPQQQLRRVTQIVVRIIRTINGSPF